MTFLGLQLSVPDLPATRRFYEGPLDLQPLSGKQDTEIRYQLGQTTLRFITSKKDEARPSHRLTLALPAAQFEAAIQRLGQRAPLLSIGGERILRSSQGRGPLAYLRDAAGNLLELASSPAEIPPLSITQVGLAVSDIATAQEFLVKRLALRSAVAGAGEAKLSGQGGAIFLLREVGSAWLPGEAPTVATPLRASLLGPKTLCLRLPGHPYHIDMLHHSAPALASSLARKDATS